MKDDMLYLVNERFESVSDVLLGEFWDDTTLLQRGKGIQSALQKSPKEVDKGNHEKATKYFSHVIIYLSPKVIENDRRAHNSLHVEHLCKILEGVHREYFSALADASDGIRYQILPGMDLSLNQVVVAFGRCVYLPGELEKPAYKLDFTVEESKASFCMSVYQNQRLALINNNRYGAQSAFKGWPFADDVSILVLKDKVSGQLEVLSEPEGRLTVSINDSNYCISDAEGHSVNLSVTALRQVQSSTVKKEQPADTQAFESDEARALSLEARMGAKNSASFNNIDERTFVAVQPAVSKLELVGVALQSLSKFQQYGFKQLRIGFSQVGEVVDPDDRLAVGVLVLDKNDNLAVECKEGNKPIQLPYEWSINSSLVIHINSPLPGLQGDYAAFIQLVKPIVFDLDKGNYQTFGRGSAAQIAPKLLVDGQMLSVDNRSVESAEQLGFSREVAKFKVDDIGLEVVPMSSNPIWHLNSDGKIIDKIEKYATHILPSEFLLSGHYLFRFAG